MEEDEIRALLERLGRPHPSGGIVVERVAILASGSDSEAILKWIDEHGGQPETVVPKTRSHGLHGGHLSESGSTAPRTPSRFVLPAGTFD